MNAGLNRFQPGVIDDALLLQHLGKSLDGILG